MLHSLMRLQLGVLSELVAISRQIAQHRRRAARHNHHDRGLERKRQPARAPAPRHMTGRRRMNRSGMGPPGLGPTPVRTGQSIRASTPTLESMDPSIEPGGNAQYAGRRVNELKRSLLRDLT